MRSAFAVLSVLLLAGALLAEEGLPPKALFEATTFDGGSIPPGADVQAQFVVRNDGAGELRILAVKPG